MEVMIVVGNAGANAESKGANGPVKVNVAASRKVKGEKVTTWYSLAFFGKLGEIAEQHIKKGDTVVAVGRFSQNENNGKTYNNVDVMELKFVGGKSKTDDDGGFGF